MNGTATAETCQPTRRCLVKSHVTTRAGQPWIYIAIWCLMGCAFLPLDVSIARWCALELLPGDIAALFARAEVFGHGYGVAGIAITIYLLDPARRKCLPWLLTTFVAAGLSANVLKLQIWRMRPRHFLESDHASTFVGSVWTSVGWDMHVFREHYQQSFPSAHTAGAVALAYALSRLYPAGRVWFYLLVVFCALNRITGNAHFASDVCWGAALGYGVAVAVRWGFRRATFARA